jgi:hypothetical protein
MTHPATPEVGGEANIPASDNPADAFEALADQMLSEEQDEAPLEQEEPTEEAEEAETDELTEDDLEDEPDLPAIEPPVSLTAEEKEAFKNLPREAQEFTARRIGELEKGFQSKAQEAAQKERQAMKQAAEYIEQVQGEAAEQIEYLSQLLVYPKPQPRLAAENPALYAHELEKHESSLAQRQQAQQQIGDLRAQQQHYQALLQQHEQEQFRQRLSEALPEFLDETSGPKVREELTATAKSLGFTDEEIFTANANQIIALKQITDLKAKADKYDQLQKRKMERVRAGKTPPPVTKPGAPRGATQVRREQADQAFARAKNLSGSARDDALAEYFTKTGIL